jgi:hypothetical protein
MKLATSEEKPMDHTAIVKERRLMPHTAGHSFWRGGKEGTVRRRILPILVAGALMAVGAAPALGNTEPSGPDPLLPPGDTFPEQPPGEPLPACGAITGNPGTSFGGVFDQHVPTFVNDQTTALLYDACLPGY